MISPQPAPDADAPPPSATAIRSRVYFVLMLLVIILGVGWSSHWIRKNIMVEYRNRPIDQATGNAMQISLALQEFDKDYGSFPSASTIADVKKATGTDFSLGHTTSNDFFRQLLATGNGYERMFYARIMEAVRNDRTKSLPGAGHWRRVNAAFPTFLASVARLPPKFPS